MLCSLQQEKEGGRGGWHRLGPGDLLAPSAPALKFGVIRSLGLPPTPPLSIFSSPSNYIFIFVTVELNFIVRETKFALDVDWTGHPQN